MLDAIETKTISWSGGTYTGQVRGDNPHGYGEFTRNDCRYVGDFKDGEFHGQGIYQTPDGDEYVGEFQEGMKHGKGTLVKPEGMVVAEWRFDDPRRGVAHKPWYKRATFKPHRVGLAIPERLSDYYALWKAKSYKARLSDYYVLRAKILRPERSNKFSFRAAISYVTGLYETILDMPLHHRFYAFCVIWCLVGGILFLIVFLLSSLIGVFLTD